MAVTLLVSAFEKCGKSTVVSKCKDAFVFNLDQKKYPFKVPHSNISEYNGIKPLIETFENKLQAYKEKYKKFPATVIFDTVSQMYSAMQRYNIQKYTNYEVHNQNNLQTLEFVHFVKDVLIAQGNINVVIVSHTVYDEPTKRHVIPSTGQFSKAGSWLGVANNAIFIENTGSKLKVHFGGLKVPARTTNIDGETSIPEPMLLEDYNIQEHLDKLNQQNVEAADLEL